MNHLRFAVLLWATVLLVPGCAGTDTVAVEFVEGVVKLDGKPVEGAMVMFQPEDTTNGVAGTGLTDANGVYHLSALDGEPGQGVPVGNYRVSIKKVVTEQKGVDAAENASAGSLTMEDYTKKMAAQASSGAAQFSYQYLIPKKYSLPASSGLTAQVKSGKNDIPFDLDN